MDHRKAKRRLVDFVAGDLDQSTRYAVTSHVEECVACRAWLETHDLLASASEAGQDQEHIDSELLALCAVQSEEQDESVSFAVRQHLENCESCRLELELIRDAVQEARLEAIPTVWATSPGRQYRWWYAAAAACVIAVALKVLMPIEQGHTLRLDSRPNDVAMRVDDPLPAIPGPPTKETSDEEIEGYRLIEAEGSLILSRVKIKDGARVTIHAGEVVAFGNGFHIGSGTRVTVGAGSRKEALDENES